MSRLFLVFEGLLSSFPTSLQGDTLARLDSGTPSPPSSPEHKGWRTPRAPTPQRPGKLADLQPPAPAALATLRAEAGPLPRCREKRYRGYFSRCLAARKAAILGSPPLVAPAASPRLRLGPKPAPLVAGRPTRCGGSAVRPRVARTFCRGCPAGPDYGNFRAKSPLSPASLRVVSESSSATRPSAWISATGTSLLGTCPSSQVRAPAGAGEVLEDVEGSEASKARCQWAS